MIKRHTKTAMAIHWFNAACWFFLLATGFALLDNEALPFSGGFWRISMIALFGSPATLLSSHIIAGSIWASVFLLIGVIGFKDMLRPFVREIFSFSPTRDLSWLFRKSIHMTLGEGVLRKQGIDPGLPDQGFYNVGQKLFAVPSLFGGIIIGVSGVILALSNVWFTETGIVQWAILIHFLGAALVSAGLIVHIYMAAISPGERPAFISMFTGTVPETYAEGHHKLWYLEHRVRTPDKTGPES